jgi:CheY-like chemotaxis protein
MDRLIDNAERFAEGGFYIIIRIYRVEDGYYSMNVSIRNLGQEIPQQKREDIFKPFVQLNEDVGNHAGLGLTVARKLAEKLGGSLSCDPSCIQGARFLLSLPPMEGRGTVITGHRLEGFCSGRPDTVLLADDDKLFRERLAGQLQNTGITVFQAGDGEEAFNIGKNEKPEILLLDSKMPLMSGRDVVKALAREGITDGMRLYLLSSGYNMDYGDFSVNDMQIESLIKPLDWSLLLDILIRDN